ncbi:MAG: nucleotide exchange factor GrpE [Leptolyngbyaceae cyanobacterium]|uniref:nucleotide exchange factor GrpE n=1 Tax=Leptodesmis sichuanensis TaxID=2906798 RepID=UPI001F29A6F5|nr:nucleotide exchange factor GrpE [Leptodesmis sichuanensis]UIE36822.1 nucleotide exchange factor GrpE [Leptodesmis sichuanensis A121]
MIDEEHREEGAQVATAGSVGAADQAPHSTSEDGSSIETSIPGVEQGTSEMAGDTLPGMDGEADTTATTEADYQMKIADLEREIQDLKKSLEDRTNQLMRSQADFENYRKRTARDKEDWELKATCATINTLLPVIDNFERARSQLKPQTEQETTIHKSYQSVYKQLVDCLKQIGVSPMRAEGKEFDPNLHEAVMRESTSEYPEGTVIEELQRGYMLGDRVLRHALVKVAVPPEPGMESGSSDQGSSDG